MATIYEVRYEEGTGVIWTAGARATRADAERLLAAKMQNDEAVVGNPSAGVGGAREARYWIEEIDTTGLFEIPPRPTPRERYTTRVQQASDPHTRTTVRVEILDGERVVATYDRNYSMLHTFEPFRQGEREFALIAPDYTATSVIDLQSGGIVASEEPSAGGFCPVGFYVPDWWDVRRPEPPNVLPGHPPDEPFARPGTLNWRDEYEWPSGGDFGFVWGCFWGDDSSWKVQYLDLSDVQNGVVRREERFGYVKLATNERLQAREFIRVWGPRHVEFAVEKEYDLLSGREITDDWDPYDEEDATPEMPNDQAS